MYTLIENSEMVSRDGEEILDIKKDGIKIGTLDDSETYIYKDHRGMFNYQIDKSEAKEFEKWIAQEYDKLKKGEPNAFTQF